MAKRHGPLIAIGGGEDKEGDCKILREFVRLAGGSKARIIVMTVATDKVEEIGKEYLKVFKRLGAGEVQVVNVSTREDAYNQESLKKIEKATAVFFTGGDQLHVTSLIGGSEMDVLLHKRHTEGMVVGGTSAGATMMSNSMMVDGPPEENPRLLNVQLGPGVEFFLGGVIDTHFSQRGRHGRLISAVAQYPHDLGLGIDENTAIVLTNGKFEVLGEGAVTVIDAGALSHTNVPDARKNESLALYDIRVHVLPEGHRFDLNYRRPLGEKRPSNGNGSRKAKRPPKPKKAAKNKG